VCLLLTGITGTALADSGIEVKLENLEKQKENNLISIKEQLTQQDMMVHYYIYEEIIEEEYNALKRKVENEYGLRSLYRADDKVRLRNGGQIFYKMGENITNDLRGYAFLVSDYYTKRQTEDIIRKYDRNNRITWKDLSRFVVETVISEKSKIPYIGSLLIGIEGTKLARDYITCGVCGRNAENLTIELDSRMANYQQKRYVVMKFIHDEKHIVFNNIGEVKKRKKIFDGVEVIGAMIA